MAAERTAHVTWSGSLLEGSGTIERVGSGAFGPLDVTWAARASEESNGRTSPEELIAAAHASCFSMALSRRARQGGHAARATRDVGDRDFRPGRRDHEERPDRARVGSGHGRGGVPRGRGDRKENCPVSKALAGVPEITVDASLS